MNYALSAVTDFGSGSLPFSGDHHQDIAPRNGVVRPVNRPLGPLHPQGARAPLARHAHAVRDLGRIELAHLHGRVADWPAAVWPDVVLGCPRVLHRVRELRPARRLGLGLPDRERRARQVRRGPRRLGRAVVEELRRRARGQRKSSEACVLVMLPRPSSAYRECVFDPCSFPTSYSTSRRSSEPRHSPAASS